jgi:hypothetical protein
MTTAFVALLRGVDGGGANRLPDGGAGGDFRARSASARRRSCATPIAGAR